MVGDKLSRDTVVEYQMQGVEIFRGSDYFFGFIEKDLSIAKHPVSEEQSNDWAVC